MMNGGLIRRLARGTDLQSAIFLQQVWLRLSNKLGRNCVSLSLSLVLFASRNFSLIGWIVSLKETVLWVILGRIDTPFC